MSPIATRVQARRSQAAYSAERILNSSSPIVTKDIQPFLQTCIQNWSDYTEEEKEAIISHLPPTYCRYTRTEDDKLVCPISAEFVGFDRVIKNNIATFQRDVADGYYVKTWQDKAKRAIEERAEGKFDQYLRDYAEEMFGGGEVGQEAGDDVGTSDGEYDSRKAGGAKRAKGVRKGKEKANQNRGRRIVADVDMDL